MADYNDYISNIKREILRDHKDYMTPDLNNWFNLDNYAEVESFNSLDWLWQLEIRFYAIHLYDCLIELIDGSDLEIIGGFDHLDLMAGFNHSEPQNDNEEEKYYNALYEHNYNALYKYRLALFHLSLDSIRKNPTGDFFTGAKAIEPYLTPIKAKAVLSYPEPAVRQLTYLDLMKLTSGKTAVDDGVLNLVIDLNAPHKALLADFKRLLKSQKHNSKSRLTYCKKGKHKPDFASWNKNNLLAHIDISFWVLEKKLKDNSFKFLARDYLKQIDPEQKMDMDTYTISRNKKIYEHALQETFLGYLSQVAIEEMHEK